MSLTLLDLIGHASFVLTAASFCVRNMLILRVLAIVSGVVGIAYNYLLPSGPLWLVIFWLSVFVTINVVRSLGILFANRRVKLSHEEARLREALFPHVALADFKRLLDLGAWQEVTGGVQLTTEGQPLDTLKILVEGDATVLRGGLTIGSASSGTLIGELSFLRGGRATATVATSKTCRVLELPTLALRELLKRDPDLERAMNQVFTLDMGKKLSGQPAVSA